ncbi:E3 SUMO-protein ligase RanBP2-like [Ostrinia furnacalis]|uniref:E3 SUMO-protein ligase RanBP2-like n=1 Tax=Ostrinia furnacalis TaxID=93504 RepID=UPI00103ADB27|nr:E3 SUMO-protein ligase RanBP2-like [Ostrinia furnacalis]
MYRNKKDVDKHVENLISKLSVKEFKTRAYSIARLYYEVGDYASCQRYVEQYLTQKDNNAAAYKLLGQALQKLGQKEKALEQYKTSLDIDPTQTSTILDICELLVDDEVNIDPGRARYWCEKAEAIFPRHPVTFRLRERLVTMSNPDSEALVDLLTAELVVRPMDAILHARLLKHYLHTNQIKKAIDHSCNVEFGGKTFHNNFAWYETLAELLKHHSHNTNDWLYQLLLLTVRERMCVLSLTETPSGPSKSLVESNELLFHYDQDIENVAKAGATPGFGEFHASLMQHHRGQFAFHSATFLLKKAKKDQMTWRDATQFAGPLMLIAWHSAPIDSKVNWLSNAPEKQQQAVKRWHSEASYRCSQSGHYLISNSQDKSQAFLERISQCCSGTHWRDKLYEKIFTNRGHLSKIKSSHFATSNAFSTPTLRLPRRIEVEAIDVDAQREYANSLHHFVWMILNYKNYAHFKCTIFDSLTPSASNYGPESLNKLDIQSFLYFAALTSKQQKSKETPYMPSDKPAVMPANITDLLCLIPHLKWWELAYLFSQNKLGADLTDIRATLSRGIEVVRCVDNHGLDPELLCIVAHIFSERAKLTTAVEEKNNLEKRAGLYYSSAIPLLEKLKSKLVIKLPEKRLFDYTHKELSSKDLNSLIEESKLFVALNYINDSEYDRAIELLSNLKSPEAFYHLSQTYRKIALEENCPKDKYVTLLTRARGIAYKAMESLKQNETYKNSQLYSDTQELVDDLEKLINKVDPDLSGSVTNDADGKYSSDENVSLVGEYIPQRSNHVFRNLSSTPKGATNRNVTNYRTAVDSHILESTQIDHRYLERIETEIRNLQKRDSTMNDFIEQTKRWFEENRKLGNEIISTIQTNTQNTTDQFKLLKISVDHVKDQIDECRNECKDVGELKKQIAEMKKEINKLKKASSEQNIDENDLYNLEDEYRTNENAGNFTTPLQFTPQVMPPFNQRLVPPFPAPPNPYQLYGQNLYNLYSQYSQFGQASQVPGAPQIFDPTRQMNYPGVYPTPDPMFLDVAQLVAQTASTVSGVVTAPTVPTLPSVSSIPTVPTVTVPSSATAVSATKSVPNVSKDSKEIPRSLPVNVVITSSDPLPTCTTTPAPILSVTIPSKHIKGTTPHNYQIPMPTTSHNKVVSPPVFSFPSSGNKLNVNTSSSPLTNWNQSTVFKTASSTGVISTPTAANDSYSSFGDTLDNSRSVVDGVGPSPNTSLNKSRTLSERSNTSVENYDPCPDFKPIIPLPAEVKVTTGEEDENVIFSARAKLFRFVDKQWKERGIGEMKLLKHRVTGKVRVLMRREQIHKICANHIITPEMEIKPMKNESKAYFWVANDFADEAVILEKFCIRFKTADIALQFYNKFEEARNESSTSTVNTPKDMTAPRETVVKTPNVSITPVKSEALSTPQTTKSGFAVGGFTFSSTPTFKPVQDDTITESKIEAPTTKANIFSGLTFKTNTSSPFSNLFSSQLLTNPSSNTSSTPQEKVESNNKLNNSDTVEEFEPNVEFKPVVPLPALVEQKTGEEDENILFEHRAKLLRFDAASKEWKERGLGNIKLLVHKDNNQKVRLLMRREQIMKVCCNHAVTKEMTFKKMNNIDKAVTWCAKDFSEGELVAETFCLRFKTVQTCDDFIEAVKSVQSKMNENTKAAKEEQNAAKQNTQGGFGEKFKPKPGSWHCETCYTNNLEDFTKCACCEQPKPQSSANDSKTVNTKPVLSTPTAVITASPAGWGDAFKPKPGSWECQNCLVRNEAAVEICTACNNPKDPSATKPGLKLTTDSTMKFRFGIPPASVPPKTDSVVTTTVTGWGDKFKPKEGTWECKQCLVRNEESFESCSACNSPKDPNAVPKESKSIFSSISSGPKFNFGIPAATPGTEQKPAVAVSSIFDGTGAHKFKFGVPSGQDTTPSVLTFGEQKATTNVFEPPKLSTGAEGPLNFSIKKTEETEKPAPKPALLPTPQNAFTNSPFGSKESSTFDFVFKPKTPPKGKSPIKSPKGQQGDDSDDNEYASEDEGHHIHFSPVIPMPDKVEVITGEENEDELYGHRAKLFIFTSGEWKERGLGVVKILKHKETGKLRVVMRREQVHKICLNHALTAEIIYKPKDEKTWLFTANDFSEGELKLQNFCLRFKNNDVATQFKDAADKARGGSSECATKADTEKSKSAGESDDVVFVSETQATTEEKQKAKELMLPENFFTYKVKEPCQGCRGCEADDEDSKSNSAAPKSLPAITTATSTPVKFTTPTFHSPATSLYGTPANFDKTADVSVFRTPLGAIGSNTKSITPTSADTTITNDTDKENSFIQKPSLFGGLGEQKTLFGTPISKNSSIFSGSETQTPTSAKTSIIAPPKLNTLNISAEEKQNTDAKSIFGAAQKNPLFGQANPVFGGLNSGTSMNKSIFSFSSSDKKDDSEKSEVKSLFGSDDQKPVNLFSGANQGSLFGPASLKDNQSKTPGSIFGTSGITSFGSNVSVPQPQVFGNGTSIFGTKQPWTAGAAMEPAKQGVTVPPKPDTKTDGSKPDSDEKKDTPFMVDNTLTFAALSTSGPGFNAQKNTDFKWEGAGQQLFTSASKSSDAANKSKNESGAGDEGGEGADEEYDPHYEPIVPLPDKIVVTTGEEDEEKIFGERGKLYRYDDKSREWKERGVGEMKILYHPGKKTYRMLLRREQVHKAVLNMLLFTDLDLLPMKNSDRAWTWGGINYAETAAGEQETLAVRFKNLDMATSFRDKVMECVRKLQALAAQAIREAKEGKTFSGVAPLRLPKHLADSARADPAVSAIAVTSQDDSKADSKANGQASKPAESEPLRQVHFQEQAEEETEEHDDEDYEHDYENQDDYDGYYNEEDDDTGVHFACSGAARVQQGSASSSCDNAHIQVLYDQDVYSPKIQVTDADTGEILADMLIHTDTDFKMTGNSCSWYGIDYTSNLPVDKTVTINFHDGETAMQFYDSCETSKAATYSSTDPES